MTIFFYTLFYLSVFTPGIPIVSAWINHKSLKKYTIITILLLPLFSLVSDLLSWWLVKRVGYQYGILHIYTFLTGTTLFFYFYHLFTKRKNWILVCQAVFTAFCVLSLFFWGGINAVNIVPNIALNIFLIFFALSYFVKAINELKYNKITHDIDFWLNFGLLLFYGTTLFISLFEAYLRHGNSDTNMYTWPILYIANILFNIILTLGIWKTRRIL